MTNQERKNALYWLHALRQAGYMKFNGVELCIPELIRVVEALKPPDDPDKHPSRLEQLEERVKFLEEIIGSD